MVLKFILEVMAVLTLGALLSYFVGEIWLGNIFVLIIAVFTIILFSLTIYAGYATKEALKKDPAYSREAQITRCRSCHNLKDCTKAEAIEAQDRNRRDP